MDRNRSPKPSDAYATKRQPWYPASFHAPMLRKYATMTVVLTLPFADCSVFTSDWLAPTVPTRASISRSASRSSSSRAAAD
ncbi:hypothetical protein DIPPA_06770 [Diplonema papillatum]|nr:hypothetical protein DIPPA_06770 [Diplonema papillatum]